jgi:hypothetical protein
LDLQVQLEPLVIQGHKEKKENLVIEGKLELLEDQDLLEHLEPLLLKDRKDVKESRELMESQDQLGLLEVKG